MTDEKLLRDLRGLVEDLKVQIASMANDPTNVRAMMVLERIAFTAMEEANKLQEELDGYHSRIDG